MKTKLLLKLTEEKMKTNQLLKETKAELSKTITERYGFKSLYDVNRK